MHAVRGITTPPIATTSDGISATTQNIIAFLSFIDGPVYESLTLPPAKEFKGKRASPEVACACHSTTTITPSREQRGENGGRNKDKYSNCTTRTTVDQHLLLVNVRSFPPVEAGPSGTITVPSDDQYLAVSHHLLFN